MLVTTGKPKCSKKKCPKATLPQIPRKMRGYQFLIFAFRNQQLTPWDSALTLKTFALVLCTSLLVLIYEFSPIPPFPFFSPFFVFFSSSSSFTSSCFSFSYSLSSFYSCSFSFFSSLCSSSTFYLHTVPSYVLTLTLFWLISVFPCTCYGYNWQFSRSSML